ncbi:MAG: hypothetical protein IH957_04855 [Chloroflexi bacterium]|nr:hypothetical protein [Chloroflexota bacterium]
MQTVVIILGVAATVITILTSVLGLLNWFRRRSRRLSGGGRIVARGLPADLQRGDASRFVRDVEGADGMILAPNQRFTKIWEIQNVGSVTWEGRFLQRVGAPSGPGLITSPSRIPIPITRPSQTVQLRVGIRAPGTEGTTTAQFKMVDGNGTMCFPDRYASGLFVTVNVVEREKPLAAADDPESP